MEVVLTKKSNGFLKLLSDDELRKIHYGALRILEEGGVKFLLPEALDIFHQGGCKVEKDGIIKFPTYIVEDAIKKAPPRFSRYPLHPSYKTVDYGSDNCYMAPGSTARYILDLDTGEKRLATMKDVHDFTIIVDALPNFLIADGGIEANDLPKSVWHAFYFEQNTKNMRKPMVAGDGLNKKISDDLARLCKVVLGSDKAVREKKTYIMTAPPLKSLTYGENVTAFISAANAGIPILIMPMPMAGSSHPVTLAGTLVQTNAEILSIVVLSQIINPGTPVIAAPIPGIMDMKYANHAFAAPEAFIMGACLAQLYRWYEIPHDISIIPADSKIPDSQAGYEKMMMMLPALAGANSMTHMGGLLDIGAVQSLVQLVIDNEIAGNILRILQGIEISDEKLAIEHILNVGLNGKYLESEHTLKYFKEELFMADLADRNFRSVWERQGSKSIEERAKDRAKKILKEHCPPPLDKDVQKELEKEVGAIYKREGVPYKPLPVPWDR